MSLRRRYIDLAEMMINSGADPNIGNVALNFAIINGDPGLVELMISKGAVILNKDKEGNTALHVVFLNFNKDRVKYGNIAQILLESGCSPNVRNRDN